MAETRSGYDDGEQGDHGLDLFTEQELVDRLVQAVTDDDLYQVVYWIKRLDEKGWIANINDGHSASTMTPIVAAASKDTQNRNRDLVLRVLRAKGGQLPSGDDAIWLELIGRWAIELLESDRDSGNEDEKVAEYLLSVTDEEAERWIAYNLVPADYRPEDGSIRSHSLPAAGPTTGRSNSIPSRYTPLGVASTSSSSSKLKDRTSSPRVKVDPGRGSSLAPVTETNLGFIDLTQSRSPSPVPKAESDDEPLAPFRSAPASSRKPSRRLDKGKGRASDSPEPPTSARAHLRVDNLPIYCTDADLTDLFSDLGDGVVVEASVQDKTNDSAWGLVTFKTLLAAQHAYAVKVGTVAPGGVRGLQIKIYSSEGRPVEAHVAVEPTNLGLNGANRATGGGGGGGGGGAGASGGERYAVESSGGSRPEGERGPIYTGQDPARAAQNGAGAFGGPGRGNFGHDEPMPFQGRFFPRPRVPHVFTAAELARRVYLGGLPHGISEDEVGRIFSEKAKVKARVLKVKDSPDGTHAFAFIQHPDSTTADFAIKSLHGQVYCGHLLQLERVNELAHRWLFSLTLYGFPPEWEYRDVSDFLISTIGSFAGLRVSRPYGRNRELNVRVELRYETELRWAANELNGLMVRDETIRAEIDQAGIRRKVERESAYGRLQDKLAHEAMQPNVAGWSDGGGGGGATAQNGYDPRAPSSLTTYDPTYPSTLPPPSPNGAAPPLRGGSIPIGGRARPAPPPPPPPPPAKRLKPDGGAVEGALRPSSRSVPVEEEPNPFSPRWMMG